MKHLSWSQLSAFRLLRHHLTGQSRADLVTVCRDVCGIQAQVMSAARMALWARVNELARADIDSALNESRTLVKTSCMRQTLHLLPADDFSIYITALKRSRVEGLRRIMSKVGVTEKDANQLNEAVLDTLSLVYRNQGWISPVVLLNGKVIGIWSAAYRGKPSSLQVELFEKISQATRDKIVETAARLGDFLQASFQVSFR